MNCYQDSFEGFTNFSCLPSGNVLLYCYEFPYLLKNPFPNAVYLHHLFYGIKFPLFFAIGYDSLCPCRADSGKRIELFGGGGVQIDESYCCIR